MLEIQLYKNSAERNKMNKSSYLSLVTTVHGNLREETSIISPEFTIEWNEQDYIVDDNNELVYTDLIPMPEFASRVVTYEEQTRLFDVNYAYVPAFQRYYYISDISSYTGKLWKISLSVDVLMSFRDKILSNYAFISRSQHNFDESLPDSKFPLLNENNMVVVRGTINSNYKLFKTWQVDNIDTDYVYVIQVAGANDVDVNHDIINNYTPYNRVYMLNSRAMEYFINKTMTDTGFDDIHWFFDSISDAIVSAKAFPFNVYGYGNSSYTEARDEIFVSRGSIGIPEDIDDNPLYVRELNGIRPFHIDLGYVSYRNDNLPKFLKLQPYINIILYLPYYGFVDIDANAFATLLPEGQTNYFAIYVKINYYIDIVTGICTCLLTNYNDKIIDTIEFNIGIDLPLGQSNAVDVARNTLMGSLKAAASILSYGSSLSADAADIDLLKSSATKKTTPKTKLGRRITSAENQLKSSIISGGGNVIGSNTVNLIAGGQSKMTGKASSDNINLAWLMYLKNIPNDSYENTPFFLIKEPVLANISLTDYAHMVGRPSCIYALLSNIRGYFEVGSIHLENIDTATEGEYEEIESLLKSGVLN